MDINKIQNELKKAGIDGWLFTDFHNRDVIGYRILGLDYGKFTSRRWYYFIPASGEPQKLVNKVESTKLDNLPGNKKLYLSYQEQHEGLKSILGKSKQIAAQYSPNNNIPYISFLEAGIQEIISGFGYEIVSSANLVQIFEAVIDENGYLSHKDAAKKLEEIKNNSFELIGKAIKDKKRLTEYELQQFIINKFEEHEMDCEKEWPIVGINEHPADPHFEPTQKNDYCFKADDTFLIDLWAKNKKTGSIFADITWCGFIGDNVPSKYMEIFNIVINARDRAVEFIKNKFLKNEICFGWEVDKECRKVIENSGYGQYFIHRTGHNIGQKVHGNGVNLDSLETKDERQLVPGVCFSIEPGIYLPQQMAVRSEIDVFITHENKVEVTTPAQKELIIIR